MATLKHKQIAALRNSISSGTLVLADLCRTVIYLKKNNILEEKLSLCFCISDRFKEVLKGDLYNYLCRLRINISTTFRNNLDYHCIAFLRVNTPIRNGIKAYRIASYPQRLNMVLVY